MRNYRRRNDAALPWIRALAFAIVATAALAAMPFYPAAMVGAVSILAALLGFASPGLAVLALVIVFSLPALAADLTLGAVMLVLGLTLTPYFSRGKGSVFLAIGLSFVLMPLHAEWAAPVVLGILLGAGEGAVAAALACLVIELTGLMLGVGSFGSLSTGGGTTILGLSPAPEGALSFAWLMPALKEFRPDGFFTQLARIGTTPMMLAQPALWALGAAVAGTALRPVTHPRRALFTIGGAAGGVAAVWAGTALASSALHGAVPMATLAAAGVFGMFVALLSATAESYVFPREVVEPDVAYGRGREEADVDELLRLISTAEETIASRHTIVATVLITDMKSFTRMTEEQGSMISAKLVQRHRDLLLPVIERHGGRGKSTGGDGLVAAFDAPAHALEAAVEMQLELERANREHPAEKPLSVRVGIARGEVVVDRGGRPFIGNGLNLAARVMDLGDGGQVLVAGDVVDGAVASEVRTFDHGPFQLKNILHAVDVREVLWAPDQEPRTLGMAAGLTDAIGETA